MLGIAGIYRYLGRILKLVKLVKPRVCPVDVDRRRDQAHPPPRLWAPRHLPGTPHTRQAGSVPLAEVAPPLAERHSATPDDGGFTVRSGGVPEPRSVRYLVRPSAHGVVTNSRPGVCWLSCTRARAVHARMCRGPAPQAAHPAPGWFKLPCTRTRAEAPTAGRLGWGLHGPVGRITLARGAPSFA